MCNKMKLNRKKNKITLRELSLRTGLSSGYLCHLENGSRNNPSYNTMKTISDILGQDTFNII